MNAIARFAFGRPVETRREGIRVVPRPATALVGRILLATIFVMAGLQKFFDYGQTVGYAQSQGIPIAGTLIVLAALTEVTGGLAIMTGLLTRIAALGLILFLIPTTLIFHDFWTMSGAERSTQMVDFLKNLAIMGGLGLLVAYGAGRYSIDHGIRKRIHRM